MKKTFTKLYTEDGQQYKITAEVRFDDECKNGHKTFAITGEILRRTRYGRWVFDSCGQIRDDIAKHFPDLVPYLKWHLCSTDGPMHYLANTIYHASDKDCWGRRKGEPSSWEQRIRFFIPADGEPFPVSFKVPDGFAKFLEKNRHFAHTMKVVEVEFAGTGPKLSSHYTLSGFKDTGNTWGFVPFKSLRDAEELLEALQIYNWEIEKVPTAWSEGKEPDLEAARETAIWPDAALEQLQDEEQLKARLPGLLAEFRAAVESLGFEW